jgi:hypothetical protein
LDKALKGLLGESGFLGLEKEDKPRIFPLGDTLYPHFQS